MDTSGLFALFRADDPDHDAVADVLEQADLLVVSPYVVAELDYLVRTRIGFRAQVRVLVELCSGAYELPALQAADLIACAGLVERYADQDIGVTDASLVVLAERYGLHTVCTLDRRHFGTIRALDGRPFQILP